MATAVAANAVPDRDRSRDRALVRAWLYAIALLIVAMVLVGGATRLTDSGLSITEWKPVHGIVPPLSDADWQEEFAKYQQIPEYQLLNRGMSLTEFKAIFWWEWAHRVLGRFIGVAFLLPLIFFWATGRIERALAPKLVGIFLLGGLQGAVGWWMVASGLSVRTDVSQYRLAIHLVLACAIFAWIIWVARGLSERRTPVATPGLRRGAALIVALVFLQIFLGGLVAGLDAGLVANTWPLMDGEIVPSGLIVQQPFWLNLFENPVTAQFDHRLVAYVLFLVAMVHVVRARGTPYASGAWLLALVVTAQAALGVATVLSEVRLHVALSHQFGAMVVLAIAVIHRRDMTPFRAPVGETA